VAFHIYFSNAAEFSVSAWTLAQSLIPVLGLFFVVLLIVLLLLPKNIKKYVLCLFTAIGILFWIQGYIINWDYGILTGDPIQWSTYTTRLIVDGLIWFAFIVFFIFFARRIISYVVFISFLLITVQGISLYYSSSKYSASPGFHEYTIIKDKRMEFSSDKNIVIILLDAFQSDIFQEIIDNNPKYKDELSGFTYFRNTTAQYSKTYGAIPALLTGRWYINKQPIQQFLSASFEHAISTRLLEEGWTTQLYPMKERIIGYSKDYASNIRLMADKSMELSDAGKLLDLGLFRVSPHYLKPFWLNDFEWRLQSVFASFSTHDLKTHFSRSTSKDFFHPILQFAHESQTALNSHSPNPVFKFFHFNIPHMPFILNEDLEYERLQPNREGFRRYSVAGLKVVEQFIAQLKEKDLYEKTMIFVLGDHGGGEYHAGILDHKEVEVNKGNIPSFHHQSGIPLLLVKPFGAKGSLHITDAPASLEDVVVTICDTLDIKHDYDGYDLFSLTEDMKRKRRYIFLEFQGWDHAYLPEMYEYEVAGHAWSPSSWKFTGQVYSPAGSMDGPQSKKKDATYKMRQSINFSRSGNSGRYIGKGWGEQESTHRWTTSKMATMQLKLEDDLRSDVLFRMQGKAYLGPKESSKKVDIIVNKQHIGTLKLSQFGWYKTVIPADVLDNKQMNIKFYIHDPVAPYTVEGSLDTRELGFSVYQMVLDPA
jgi:hypothetical protein